jgi:hypothetical protein
MRSSPNQAVAERFWTEVYGAGNVDVLDQLVSPRFILHDLGQRKTYDAEEVKYLIQSIRNDVPDFSVRVDSQVSAGNNRVFTELTFRAAPADGSDGEPLEFHAMAISQFSRQRMTNVRLLWESLRAEHELKPPIRVPRWKWPPWG